MLYYNMYIVWRAEENKKKKTVKKEQNYVGVVYIIHTIAADEGCEYTLAAAVAVKVRRTVSRACLW